MIFHNKSLGSDFIKSLIYNRMEYLWKINWKSGKPGSKQSFIDDFHFP